MARPKPEREGRKARLETVLWALAVADIDKEGSFLGGYAENQENTLNHKIKTPIT